MIFKSYFDGGNEPNSKLYDVITLSTVSGTKTDWAPFENEWKRVLRSYGVAWLHTTDAATFNEPYTRAKGWTRERRDKFMSECVGVLEKHMSVPHSGRQAGLVPYVVTVVLEDFLEMRRKHPDELPVDVTELCATQAVQQVVRQGAAWGANFFHFIFDQNEGFMRHVDSRSRNKKAKAHLGPYMERITSVGEADMRTVPGLQAADLFAWCVSHKSKRPRYRWQNRLLNKRQFFDDWYSGEAIVEKLIPGTNALVRSWHLPATRATR